MIEKYDEQEDDLNILDERQVSDKVYILEGESYEFHYKNEKDEMLSFIGFAMKRIPKGMFYSDCCAFMF